MLTIQEINNHFVSIMPLLKSVATGIAYKNGRNMDSDAIVNEAYIYVIERHSIMKDKDFMQRSTINWIRQILTWKNTNIYKQQEIRSIEYTIDVEDTSDSEIKDKIEIEEWFNHRTSLIEEYRYYETDRVKRIILECYYDKGIIKGVDLAKHLNINKDAASKYIRELKQDIRNFAENIRTNMDYKPKTIPYKGIHQPKKEEETPPLLKKKKKNVKPA